MLFVDGPILSFFCGNFHGELILFVLSIKRKDEMDVMKSEALTETKKRRVRQTEKEKHKVDMPEDMQNVMAKCIFTGPVAEETVEKKHHLCGFAAPGGNLRTIWHLAPHVGKAALVCRTWNKGYKDYLVTGVGELFQSVCERAVDLALNMCDCDEYSERRFLSQFTRVVYSAFRGEQCLFTMRFTRMGSRQDDTHELVAVYAVPEDRVSGMSPRSPVKTIKLPRVCGISVRVIETAQLAEFRKWRKEQVAALEGWLGEQHAVFHGRPVVQAGI